MDKEGKFVDLLKFYLIQLYKRTNSNELLLCNPYAAYINIFFSNVFPLDRPKDGLEVTGVLEILFSNQLICLVRSITWAILNDSKLIRSMRELLRWEDLWHRRVSNVPCDHLSPCKRCVRIPYTQTCALNIYEQRQEIKVFFFSEFFEFVLQKM